MRLETQTGDKVGHSLNALSFYHPVNNGYSNMRAAAPYGRRVKQHVVHVVTYKICLIINKLQCGNY